MQAAADIRGRHERELAEPKALRAASEAPPRSRGDGTCVGERGKSEGEGRRSRGGGVKWVYRIFFFCFFFSFFFWVFGFVYTRNT